MLYYIKHEVIGDMVQQIADGVPAKYVLTHNFVFIEIVFVCCRSKNSFWTALLHIIASIFNLLSNPALSKLLFFCNLKLHYKEEQKTLNLEKVSEYLFLLFNI